jgi:hypothetical protein
VIQHRNWSSSLAHRLIATQPRAFMASDNENQDWNPQRTESILGTEATTTSTENVNTAHSPSTPYESRETTNNGAGTSRTKDYGSIVKGDEDQRPQLQHTQTSSTEIGDEKDCRLQRTQTSKSARERREFAPIRAGDAAELTRLATELDGGGSVTRTSTATGLERRDTLAGINIGDAVLDPRSPEFDPYKWARM